MFDNHMVNDDIIVYGWCEQILNVDAINQNMQKKPYPPYLKATDVEIEQ